MAQLRQLGKHTLVYTAGIVIGKIASFVMLPVYTRFLTPADYGVLELLGMTIDVISMIASVGIVTGVFKFYSDESNQTGKDAVISTAAISAVALAAATSAVGIVVSPFLSTLIFGRTGNPLYLQLYFLIYFLQTFEYLPYLLIRAQNRSGLFVTLNASKLVLTLSLNILFVVVLKKGIEGVLISNIIATSTSAIVLSGYLLKHVGFGFSRSRFLQLFHFGRAIVPWSLASFVLVFSDRYFLNYYTNTATVGIYSLAYKFAFLLSVMAYTPFETVWAVHRFAVAKQPDAPEVFSRVFLYVNVILGGIALVICLFIRDFLIVMSAPAFRPAYRLVPILLTAQVIFVWGAYWTTGIYVTERTEVMASGSIVLVAITVALNFLLIPEFGAFGAAWATTLAYSARFFWIYYFSEKYYPIRYRWHDIAKLFAVLAAGVAVNFAYHPESMLGSLAYSTAILAVAVYAVFVIILSPDDRAGLGQLVNGLVARARPADRLAAERK